MSYVAPGTTWDAAGVVTYQGLHTLIEGSTWTSISLSEFSHLSHLVQYGADEPVNRGEGGLWYDETNKWLRQRTQGWDVPHLGPHMINGSTNTLVTGQPVRAKLSNSYEVTHAARNGAEQMIGVALAEIAPGHSLIVKRFGLGLVRIEGPCSRGDLIICKNSGNAQSAKEYYGSGLAGTFTSGKAFAMAFYPVSAGVTATVTCLIFGG